MANHPGQQLPFSRAKKGHSKAQAHWGVAGVWGIGIKPHLEIVQRNEKLNGKTAKRPNAYIKKVEKKGAEANRQSREHISGDKD